jgi:hypothetical protein
MAAGDAVTFMFDLAFTPSKPLDLQRHWKSRWRLCCNVAPALLH